MVRILRLLILVHILMCLSIGFLATENTGILLAIVVFPIWLGAEFSLLIGLGVCMFKKEQNKAPWYLWFLFLVSTSCLTFQLMS